jgi:serine/threonine protein kinase
VSKAQNTLGAFGNYELLAEIGRGNFGTVYQARHWETGREVAVKSIHPALLKNAVLLKRFKQECLVAAKIDHPNTVRVLEYSLRTIPPFLVMELVEGMSLGERLESKGKLTEAEAIRLTVQACQGLDQMHSLGLLHRDVKPDNLMVTPNGQLKITDLGMAKHIDTGLDLTRPGTGLGTPNFIAPEQFHNAKNVDRRCDVYGLGATLYQLVTGVLPFAGAHPMEILTAKLKGNLVPPEKIIPWLGESTRNAIMKALQVEPEQRFASCWEFAEALVETDAGLGAEFEHLAVAKDQWYVIFHDAKGRLCRGTASRAGLAQALRDGQLGEPAKLRLARTLAGPFRPLREFPGLVHALARTESANDAASKEPRCGIGTLRLSSVMNGTDNLTPTHNMPVYSVTGGKDKLAATDSTPTNTNVPPVARQAPAPQPAAPSRRPAPNTPPTERPVAAMPPGNPANLTTVRALRAQKVESDSNWWQVMAVLLVGGSAAFAAARFLLPYLK